MELTVLLVDDEDCVRSYLKTILQRENFQVFEAGDAPQAIRLVQKLKGALDLILTDVSMPGDMDGLDLAHTIRNSFPSIPVILMSGYQVDSTKPTGEFTFIEKPFKPEVILQAVEKAISDKRLTASS